MPEEVSINELIAQGIDLGDVKMLENAGINTCNHLVTAYSKESLTGIEGFSEAKVDKIWESAEKLVKHNDRFQLAIVMLKSYLDKVGSEHSVNGAVLCRSLDDAATKFAFAFPSNEKVKYANFVIAAKDCDSSYEYEEYEDDEADKEKEKVDLDDEAAKEKEKEEALDFIEQVEVNALVLEELVKAQKKVDAHRFNSVIEHTKKKLKKMTVQEISDVIAQSRSLIEASSGEIKMHVQKKKEFLDELKENQEERDLDAAVGN